MHLIDIGLGCTRGLLENSLEISLKKTEQYKNKIVTGKRALAAMAPGPLQMIFHQGFDLWPNPICPLRHCDT